jgi:hypothetical protein
MRLHMEPVRTPTLKQRLIVAGAATLATLLVLELGARLWLFRAASDAQFARFATTRSPPAGSSCSRATTT